MTKKIVTKEDLENIPGLAESGVQEGEEIDAPEEGLSEGGEVGGSKPPDTKEKPERP